MMFQWHPKIINNTVVKFQIIFNKGFSCCGVKAVSFQPKMLKVLGMKIEDFHHNAGSLKRSNFNLTMPLKSSLAV